MEAKPERERDELLTRSVRSETVTFGRERKRERDERERSFSPR